MTLPIYNVSYDPADIVRITCIDHPGYQGSRQTAAVLAGCLGCRAVYAVRRARAPSTMQGRSVPVLRVEVDVKPLRRFA